MYIANDKFNCHVCGNKQIYVPNVRKGGKNGYLVCPVCRFKWFVEKKLRSYYNVIIDKEK